MTIEIHRPELETLIRERMNSGAFQNAEDVILQALRSAPAVEPPHRRTGQELIDICAKVCGFLTDEEVDTLFSRTHSFSRPVDFE
jgi:Arc/MetJ-type ribon-helix-helix transcriptional regulator